MNTKSIEKDYKLAKEILSKIEIINKKDLTDFINQYLDEENCYKLDTVINILKADKQKETFFNSKKFFQELDKKNPKENLKYNNKDDTLQGSSVNIKILVLRDGNLIIINGTNSEENRWYDNDDLQDNDILLGMEVYTETYNKKEMYPKGNLEIVKFETPVIFRKEYLKNKKEENIENTINYNDLINEEKLKALKAMVNKLSNIKNNSKFLLNNLEVFERNIEEDSSGIVIKQSITNLKSMHKIITDIENVYEKLQNFDNNTFNKNEEEIKRMKKDLIEKINQTQNKIKKYQADLNSFIESVAEKTGIEIKNEDDVEIIDDINNKQKKNKNLKLK